jgi:hypothetical protein
MDNDYPIDVDEIVRTVRSAEVLTIRFLILEKRLLIDNRYNEIDGPIVRLVDRVRSAEERFRSLRQLRPRFPVPEKITAIWWPKFVTTLDTLGIWPALVRRMADTGFGAAVRECSDAFEEMKRMERQVLRGAVTGEEYQTIWPRSG